MEAPIIYVTIGACSRVGTNKLFAHPRILKRIQYEEQRKYKR
jgi:hypothetical protein